MFEKYKERGKEINPITECLFEYVYHEDTGIIERKGLKYGVLHIVFWGAILLMFLIS